MRIPVETSFKHVESTAAMESLVRERVDRLKRFHRGITACRVSVEAPHRSGNAEAVGHRVRVEVSVPGKNIVVSRDRNFPEEEYDPYTAIRAAFNAAERQLKSRAGKLRRGRRRRVGPPHAVVERMFPDEGYGFLSTDDGRQVYFHRNSVVNDRFEELEPGEEVRFEETDGDEGPQATTVAPIGEHGSHEMT